MNPDTTATPMVKLGALVVTTTIFLASITGGYYTYGLLADTETVGVSIQVSANISSTGGNTPTSSVGNMPTSTETNHSTGDLRNAPTLPIFGGDTASPPVSSVIIPPAHGATTVVGAVLMVRAPRRHSAEVVR